MTSSSSDLWYRMPCPHPLLDNLHHCRFLLTFTMAEDSQDITSDANTPTNLPRISIKFCTQCKWMLRAAYVRTLFPHPFFSSQLNLPLCFLFIITYGDHFDPVSLQSFSASPVMSQMLSVQIGMQEPAMMKRPPPLSGTTFSFKFGRIRYTLSQRSCPYPPCITHHPPPNTLRPHTHILPFKTIPSLIIIPRQFAQELLSTFSTSLGEVALVPSTGGVFIVAILYQSTPSSFPSSSSTTATTSSADDRGDGVNNGERVEVKKQVLWDRKAEGGFPGSSLDSLLVLQCLYHIIQRQHHTPHP